jgi:hypothetical protein
MLIISCLTTTACTPVQISSIGGRYCYNGDRDLSKCLPPVPTSCVLITQLIMSPNRELSVTGNHCTQRMPGDISLRVRNADDNGGMYYAHGYSDRLFWAIFQKCQSTQWHCRGKGIVSVLLMRCFWLKCAWVAYYFCSPWTLILYLHSHPPTSPHTQARTLTRYKITHDLSVEQPDSFAIVSNPTAWLEQLTLNNDSFIDVWERSQLLWRMFKYLTTIESPFPTSAV